MLYMLAIYADEAEWTAHSEAENKATLDAHRALEEDLRKAGKFRHCGGLSPTESATTLRYEGGVSMVTDGPYAEAKEQFGGYYVVEAVDLDDAIGIARRIPVTQHAAIEVRPVAIESLLE